MQSPSLLMVSLKDYFSKKFMLLSIAPLAIPLVLFGFLLVYVGGEFSVMMADSASGQSVVVDQATHPIIAWLLGFYIVNWLVVTLFYLFGTVFVMLSSLVVAVIVIGLLTPFIVSIIRKRHYPSLQPYNDVSFIDSFFALLWIFAKFLVAFLVALPFLLVPFLNILIFYIPFFYLFYKLMILDMLSCGIADKKTLLGISKEYQTTLLVTLFGFFMLSLVPFAGLFLQTFFVIYLSHFFFQKVTLKTSS
ncbi:MAG: EI24 domain-containing protein [Sulfurospirillaceae bacterium]|nr:EI24 domain-containing protein [Sulfurospirillaceae bacterium]